MKIIGHRGAKGLAPENTLAAFKKGLEHHVDEIELDVRVTNDGHCVLVHDPFVTDPSGQQLKVADHSFAELQAHKPDLCELEPALRFINKHVPVIIEVKPGVPTTEIVAVMRRLLEDGWSYDDFWFASFDQAVLRQLHRALPEARFVINESWSGVRARLRARELGTKRLSMRSWWLWSGFLIGMKRGGYEISPYVLNDPKKAHKWAKYGIYGAVTDYPDLYQSRSHHES